MPKGRIVEISAENKLEEILRLAADEPAHRPQFCEVLLSSQVFLLGTTGVPGTDGEVNLEAGRDRKSTRLNSSHVRISYAAFCLKKKKSFRPGAHRTPWTGPVLPWSRRPSEKRTVRSG